MAQDHATGTARSEPSGTSLPWATTSCLGYESERPVHRSRRAHRDCGHLRAHRGRGSDDRPERAGAQAHGDRLRTCFAAAAAAAAPESVRDLAPRRRRPGEDHSGSSGSPSSWSPLPRGPAGRSSSTLSSSPSRPVLAGVLAGAAGAPGPGRCPVHRRRRAVPAVLAPLRRGGVHPRRLRVTARGSAGPLERRRQGAPGRHSAWSCSPRSPPSPSSSRASPACAPPGSSC